MFLPNLLLTLLTANAAILDPCSHLLATADDLPEIYEPSSWRTRNHLTVARGGRVTTLEQIERTLGAVQLYSIAIPVYRELYNGNLKRLLGQIARQTVSPGRVQVVVMVNNSIKHALDADDPVLIENKRTVAWLRQIRTELPYRLEILDETCGIDRVMGTLRNRALNHAMAITDVAPRRHVMINLDADVTIAPDYLQRLDSYYGRFDVDAVITRRGHTLPKSVDPIHFQLIGVSEYGHVNHDMENVADFPKRGYVTPQITARASVVRELGGFGYIDFEEDFDFGKRLGQHTIVMAPDIYVAQSDRAREDGFAAAKRARIINNAALNHGEIDRGLPKMASMSAYASTALNAYYAKLERRVFEQRLSGFGALVELEKVARRCFHHAPDSPLPLDSAAPEKLLVRAKHVDQASCDLNMLPFFSRLAQMPQYSRPYDIGSYLMTALSLGLRGAERRRFNDRVTFRQEFERHLIARRLQTIRSILRDEALGPALRSDIFEDHLRERTSALRQDIDLTVRQRRLESANHGQPRTAEDTMLEKLILRYPDFLDESLSDPWVVQNQSIRFLNDWFLRARASPEEYPVTTEFLALRLVR